MFLGNFPHAPDPPTFSHRNPSRCLYQLCICLFVCGLSSLDKKFQRSRNVLSFSLFYLKEPGCCKLCFHLCFANHRWCRSTNGHRTVTPRATCDVSTIILSCWSPNTHLWDEWISNQSFPKILWILKFFNYSWHLQNRSQYKLQKLPNCIHKTYTYSVQNL